jgi:fatty-acyl-CoA synthase
MVVLTPDSNTTAEDLRAFLRSRVARWWVPERLELVSEIPKTGVGKYDKRAIRTELASTPTRETTRSAR